MLALAYATFMAAIDIVSLSLLKMVHNGTFPFYGIFLSVLIYATQPLFFYSALSFEGMAVMNLLWNVISSFTVTMIGVFYFKERLTRTKMIGAALSILAIGLLGSE